MNTKIRIVTRLAGAVCLMLTLGACPKAKEEVERALGRPLTPEQTVLIHRLGDAGNRPIPMEPIVIDGQYRMKVITKRRGIRCSSMPNGERDGVELEYFHPYFVFDKEEQGGFTYYHIGVSTRRADVLGWVSSLDAQRWDTRLADEYDRPDSDGGRSQGPIPRLYVYKTKDDAILALKGEEVEPLAQAEYKYEYSTLMPWPIVSKETVTIGNRNHELHELAFLLELPEGADLYEPPVDITPADPANSASAEEKEKYRLEFNADIRQVDVVFVVDTTGSMQPYIDQAKESVRKISRQLKNMSFKPDIAFGLVQYRDYVDGLYFPGQKVYKVHPLTSDFGKFLAGVDAVVEASISSEDHPEAVADGLNAALFETKWRTGLAERIFILIGDEFGHLPGHPKNPKSISMRYIVESANRKGVTIFSLLAPCRSPQQEAVDLHRQQFTELAIQTGGQAYALKEAINVVPFIEEIVEHGSGKAKMKVKTAVALARGDISVRGRGTGRIAVTGTSDHETVEVLKIWATQGVNFSMLAPGETVFSTGWVVTEAAGIKILNRKVYLARNELRFLIVNLNLLVNSLHEPKSMMDLVGMLKNKRVGEHDDDFPALSTFFTGDDLLTMDERFIVDGIPVGEHSILNFTRREILTMPESKRLQIAERIDRYFLPLLTNEQTDDKNFSDPDPASFGWINESSVP